MPRLPARPRTLTASEYASRRVFALRGVAMALVLAGLFSSGDLMASRGVEPSGRATYDPLLSEPGNVCAPAVAGRPPLLQKLILAQTETKPFKPQPMQAAGGEVPLYDNLGTLSFKVGTRNAKAQAYFDQGIRWAFAFNHAEAQRAFQAAQKADPKLAMAWWGEALVLGPNINAPMMPEAVAPALAALAKAVELAPGAPAKDRALIAALQKRYSADPKAERAALDAAYADAMKSVAEKYPGDDTILTLYAESVMDTQAWDYWEAGGAKPKGRAAELLAALEKVLARNPKSPGSDPPLHPRGRGVDEARARAAARATAGRVDAGRGPRRAHAGPHLLPRRPVQGVAGNQQARDGRRRAVLQDLALGPDVQVGLLPAQHPLRAGLGADGWRRPDRDRCRGASSTHRCPTRWSRSLRCWNPSRPRPTWPTRSSARPRRSSP